MRMIFGQGQLPSFTRSPHHEMCNVNVTITWCLVEEEWRLGRGGNIIFLKSSWFNFLKRIVDQGFDFPPILERFREERKNLKIF